jgi:hypothetical protein
VAFSYQRLRTSRYERDAILVCLDLFRNAYLHLGIVLEVELYSVSLLLSVPD